MNCENFVINDEKNKFITLIKIFKFSSLKKWLNDSGIVNNN